MGNAWWTINNLNCGTNVNIKITCCNNFTQIAKIQPIKGVLVNITKFAFGANSFLGESKRICDRQTPINLIKKSSVRKLNMLDQKFEYFRLES
jgi:hypothetical protein